MRMWRNGNASPCRGEDPGPIPGIRSRGALDQSAGVTALRPQDVRVRIPRALLSRCHPDGMGSWTFNPAVARSIRASGTAGWCNGNTLGP
jgi:hypothetical protein